MYIEDNNLMYSYRGLDKNLLTDADTNRMDEYDKMHDPDTHDENCYVDATEYTAHPYSNMGFDKYDDSFTMQYKKIEPYNGLNYIPSAFTEKYEICLWKVDELNVAKVKQKYFTPPVSSN